MLSVLLKVKFGKVDIIRCKRMQRHVTFTSTTLGFVTYIEVQLAYQVVYLLVVKIIHNSNFLQVLVYVVSTNVNRCAISISKSLMSKCINHTQFPNVFTKLERSCCIILLFVVNELSYYCIINQRYDTRYLITLNRTRENAVDFIETNIRVSHQRIDCI